MPKDSRPHLPCSGLGGGDLVGVDGGGDGGVGVAQLVGGGH